MKTTERTQYHDRLVDLQRRLAADTDSRIAAVGEQSRAPGDISNVPTHPADRDIEGLDAEIAAGRTQEELLDEIEAALERLEAGSFGTCEQCGGEIEEARLEELPFTALCARCAGANAGTP